MWVLDRLFSLFLLKWSNVIFSFFWKLWKHQEHKVSHFDLPSWKNNSSMLCMSMFYTRLCCIWTSSLPSSHGIWDCNTSKFHISTSEIYLEGVHGFAGVLKKKKPFVLISGCRPAILKWICFCNNPNPTLLIGWLILCLLLLLYILKLQEETAIVNDSSVYQVTLSEPSSSASNGQQYAVITGLPSTGWCIWLGLGLNIHTFNRLQSSLIM